MNGWSADVILDLLIPFAGTAAGSACVSRLPYGAC